MSGNIVRTTYLGVFHFTGRGGVQGLPCPSQTKVCPPVISFPSHFYGSALQKNKGHPYNCNNGTGYASECDRFFVDKITQGDQDYRREGH